LGGAKKKKKKNGSALLPAPATIRKTTLSEKLKKAKIEMRPWAKAAIKKVEKALQKRQKEITHQKIDAIRPAN